MSDFRKHSQFELSKLHPTPDESEEDFAIRMYSRHEQIRIAYKAKNHETYTPWFRLGRHRKLKWLHTARMIIAGKRSQKKKYGLKQKGRR